MAGRFFFSLNKAYGQSRRLAAQCFPRTCPQKNAAIVRMVNPAIMKWRIRLRLRSRRSISFSTIFSISAFLVSVDFISAIVVRFLGCFLINTILRTKV